MNPMPTPTIAACRVSLTIEPRAAHTFIHYLSTGQYETLYSVFPAIKNAADATETLRARDIEELTRAAHTYAAAVLYEVPGLQELARGFLGLFTERLPTEDILKVTREIYDSLRDMELARTWLEAFVGGCLEVAFSDGEVSLRQIIRIERKSIKPFVGLVSRRYWKFEEEGTGRDSMFRAETFVLPEDEGGAPIADGDRRTITDGPNDVEASLSAFYIPGTTFSPGEVMTMSVKIDQHLKYLQYLGSRFAVKQDGKLMALGIVRVWGR
ncbi:uncharacterized protein BO97DRAFT_413620 [Aspergillus homomorphus CBS 101889]|uniref:Uncharacterized protein n=1 Tax=Aspergillus homomorphus (strain CBS 101889) TaxID=1450537 RepID=A0A395I1X2_ASPHC|nr:hypothetical protein BO97DRAFT_413620 [Aspergillus homomorphus CBS 101889]RAL13168.1 hypothetical protein BO97DRAFT_413620 [Aspergillus homomorphus CBS 101889]